MQFADPFSDRIVKCATFTFTFSLYVPSSTQIVSPLLALSTASCICVLLELNVLPLLHQPDVFTQMSPHGQVSADASAGAMQTASIAATAINTTMLRHRPLMLL